MKRNIVGLMVFFLSVFMLAGCNSKSSIAIMDNHNSNQESASRSSFYWSGASERTIHVNDEDARNVVFDIDMKKGSLTCDLKDSDGNVVYTLSKEGAYTGTEQFKLDKTGDYKLTAKGKSFCGSYKISWNVEEGAETAASGETETASSAQ